jgi:hypothetical protein
MTWPLIVSGDVMQFFFEGIGRPGARDRFFDIAGDDLHHLIAQVALAFRELLQ